MKINSANMHYRELNEIIKNSIGNVRIVNCIGQKYIASGLSDRKIVIDGVPGNALGCYLDGAEITVNGNVQDAVGDTMNAGKIVVHGGAGDVLGYAMRGGKIFVRDNSGYRTGIHMKAYKEKKPVIVIGGKAGDFLGEYMAGGIIIILNLYDSNVDLGQFTGVGMHGGKIYIRELVTPKYVSPQISVSSAQGENELEEIVPYLKEFCTLFDVDIKKLLESKYTVLYPNASNPYRQMYTHN
ncbi:MAG TPA: glutamate synthase [Clostridia bacterium]